MTTISYPSSNAGNLLIGAIGGALAMLVLVAAMALAALNAAPPIQQEPAPAPAPQEFINSNSSGVMEHAP